MGVSPRMTTKLAVMDLKVIIIDISHEQGLGPGKPTKSVFGCLRLPKRPSPPLVTSFTSTIHVLHLRDPRSSPS